MNYAYKIIKYYKGGKTVIYFVNSYDDENNEDLRDIIIEWADNEPSGRAYGYQLYWEFEKEVNKPYGFYKNLN